MGGGGGPVSAIKKEVKKATKEVAPALKFLGSAATGPVGMASYLSDTAFGTKTGKFAAPGGEAAGGAGKTFVDKPAALKKEAARLADAAAKENESQLKRIKKQQDQSAAEAAASEDLAAGRARQMARKRKAGRDSTLVTDKLGDAGGENNQGRKTLLGL